MTNAQATPNAFPTRPPSTVIATYPQYAEAQKLVDLLSDKGFAVQHVRIIGRGLHSVEQVLSRLTTGRAALMGAASGAWMGLLFGLLLSLFTTSDWWKPVLLGIGLGLVWGAILGAISHAATRGQRDFASAQRLEADNYEVEVDTTHAEAAQNIVGQLKMVSGQ